MATYKVVDADQLNADMTSVADSIRTKGGTTETLAWPDGYKTAIEAIQTGGGGGVFEVFEATTNDRATLAAGPSLEDIAGCYSRGKIPIIKLAVSDEEISQEFICTTGARLYNSDIPIGSLTFDCVYLDSVGAADGIWAAISIMYQFADEPLIRTGRFAKYGT